MKKKVVVGVVTLSLLLGTTAAYAAYDKHAKETQSIEHYEQVEKSVWNLYDNDLQTIVEGITLENIDQVKKQVMEIESVDQRKPLLKLVDEAQIIFNAKELMANLIIDGLYVEDITNDQVIKMNSAIEKIKPFNENLYKTFKADMDYAAEQYSYLSSALLDLEKLKEKPNRTLYKEVSEQINKLNAIQKVKLSNELEDIDQILIAQEKEEKRIAKENAEKEEIANQQKLVAKQENNNTNIHSNSTKTVINNDSSNNYSGKQKNQQSNQVVKKNETQIAQNKQSEPEKKEQPSKQNQSSQPVQQSKPQNTKPVQQQQSKPQNTQPAQQQQSKPQDSKTQQESKPSNGGHLGSVEINNSGNTMDSWEVSDSELNDLFGN